MTDDLATPTFPAIPRRGKVVLQHTTGPLAGMFRIMGDLSTAPDPLPVFLDSVHAGSQCLPASLVAHHTHYAEYHEIHDPRLNKNFDPLQR